MRTKETRNSQDEHLKQVTAIHHVFVVAGCFYTVFGISGGLSCTYHMHENIKPNEKVNQQLACKVSMWKFELIHSFTCMVAWFFTQLEIGM